eukprot:TRINITY_DN1331_c0_g1_i7.p1 TRINITY_DN1331_c0_g1~~TRINITY_DN1331_c0_g1_i7.p1  ORF type:complete len:918 (+),score=238.62 TRINITY_DN1331_c0_g1_i7:41-2794(+)
MKTVLALLCLIPAATSKLIVPQWISDGMILQMNRQYGARSFLNGISDAGSKVTITAGSTKYIVDADPVDGKWEVMINPSSSHASINIAITNTAGDKINVNGATFGDVLFCSGQSNMVFPMENVLNATEELATLANFQQFRFFQTALNYSSTPLDVLEGGACTAGICNSWVDAQTAGAKNYTYLKNFSAMCYLTARELTRLRTIDAGTPVGLVQSAYGGTRVEAWMPESAFDSCPQYKNLVPARKDQNAAMALYNAMINPFKTMSVRATIWYQGEANADEKIAGVDQTAYYACMYQAMIASWRDKKGMGDFAWITQQLPPSVVSGTPMSQQLETGRIQIRLAEAETVPHTDGLTDISGMSVGLDMGGRSAWGVDHPPNKNEMSRRMALSLYHVAFGVQGRFTAAPVGSLKGYNSYWTGPVFKSATQTADGVVISVDEGSGFGMSLKDVEGLNVNGSSAGCTLCCAKMPPFEVFVNGNWSTIPASSVTTATDVITLKVQGTVSQVRYAWSDFVECVLYNNDSLPLGPFLANLTSSPSTEIAPVGVKEQPIQSPPLGFNSWNFYHCNIDENTVKKVIDAMVANGMKDAGYQYVNIDDCWQVGRTSNGTIIPDPVRFPSGMKHLADYAHSKGMKFGVYTARAQNTCQDRPGSYGMEVIDADTYCDWGIDYVKIDVCHGQDYKNVSSSWMKFHSRFEACYQNTGRYIVQSVESCGDPNTCGQWVPNMANLWRTGGDVQANWESVMHNAAVNNAMQTIAKPGHFNDADMLEVGDVGLSYDEEVSHFSIWAIMSSAMLAGTDLVNPSNETLAILTNKEVIAVNQDLGLNNVIQGKMVNSTKIGNDQLQVWGKHMSNGDVAVLLVNNGAAAHTITASWEELGIPSGKAMKVRDLWTHTDLSPATNSYSRANIKSHACAFVLLSPQ